MGPAVDLGEWYEAYRQHKREVVAEVTLQVEGRVRALLAELVALGTPLES